jgi:hypothetical protein
MVAALSSGAACDRHGGAEVQRRPPAAAPAPESTSIDPASDWVSHVGQPALPKRPLSASEVKIEPAAAPDSDYTGRTLVTARRLVYRFTLVVPPALRANAPFVSVPAGELHVDVSDQRLRARFVGPGWPVDEGSEVRLRRDVPGVYLFDGEGGRPLPPGQLASWFQGQPGSHAHAELIVRHDPLSAPNDGPGDLLCVLLAEWTQSSRDGTLAGCGGWLPNGFHFGMWSADLTAIVPMNLPRAELRADTVAPPAPVATSSSRALLDATDLARITATPARAGSLDLPPYDAAAVSGEGLTVDNRTPARIVIVLQGIPIGWIKADARGHFGGLAPGYYHVAALRTSGLQVLPSSIVRVPGELRVGHPDAPAAQLGEPLLGSPDAAR